MLRCIEEHTLGKLTDIRLRLREFRRVHPFAYCRKKKCRKHGCDSDHHKNLDQGESVVAQNGAWAHSPKFSKGKKLWKTEAGQFGTKWRLGSFQNKVAMREREYRYNQPEYRNEKAKLNFFPMERFPS